MELRQYGQLARKWLWLVVLCAVAAGGVAYVVSKKSTPIYQASTKLLVNQASSASQLSPGYTDILSSQQLARTYANLLADGAGGRRHGPAPGLAHRSAIDSRDSRVTISVAPIRDTQLLEVKVEGPDPTLTALIANTLPAVFIDRNLQLQMGRVSGLKTSLEKELASVQDDIARAQGALAGNPDDAQRQRLETSLAQYRTTLSSLANNYNQIRIAEAQATNNVVIAKPAVVPLSPVRPRTMTNVLLAMIVGGMLAVGAAFLVEYLDDTVKSPDDVTRVTGLSTLGAIARLKDAGSQRQLISWVADEGAGDRGLSHPAHEYSVLQR